MATETVTDTTVPKREETESTEFEKNRKRYQDLISTFPHAKGWMPKETLFGYGGYWCAQPFLEGSFYAQEFFQARPGDFLICSYPKTGTTWLKALAFTITNRSRIDDFTNPLLKLNPHELVPFIEYEFSFFPQVDVLKDKGNTLFSTHMPYELLPHSVGSRVVRWFTSGETQRTLSSPCGISYKREGFSVNGPYLDHTLAYWKARQENPNQILFLNYETLSADPLPYAKRLAEFMGYGFTVEEEKNGVVEKVVNLCSFETMKNLEANKGDKEREDHPSPYTNSAFFRKGKTGDWENYLTPDMAARMDELAQEKFKGTGLLENGK
ncbi:Cytosolic sulfotransferase 18 [Raphanus sativus]|nr:Cytosolic sulfotransferase 18 [Raphanus sativus]